MIKKSLILFVLVLVMFSFFVNVEFVQGKTRTECIADCGTLATETEINLKDCIDSYCSEEVVVDTSNNIQISISNLLNPLKNRASNLGGFVKEITGNIWTGTTRFLGFDQVWITRGNLMDNLLSGAGIAGIISAILMILLLILSKFASDISENYTWSKAGFSVLSTIIFYLIYLVALSADEGAFFYNISVGFLAGLFVALFDVGLFFVTESDDSREEKIAKFLYEKLILTLIVLPVIYATLMFVPFLSTFLKTVTFYYFTPFALKAVILAVLVGVIPRIIIARNKAKDRAKKISGMEKIVLGAATMRSVGDHA